MKSIHAYFDIDRTLLNKGQKKIEARLRNAIKLIPFRGVNTMRNIVSAKKPFEPGDLNLPFITLNGAQIWNQDNTLLHYEAIDEDSIKFICNLINEKHEFIIEIKAYLATTKTTLVYSRDLIRKEEIIEDFGDEMNVVFFENATTLATYILSNPISYLGLNFTSPLTVDNNSGFHNLKIIESRSESKYSIYPKAASKKNALKWMSNYLGIELSKILTAGDDHEIDGPTFAESIGISVGETKHVDAQHHSNVDNLAELLEKLYS